MFSYNGSRKIFRTELGPRARHRNPMMRFFLAATLCLAGPALAQVNPLDRFAPTDESQVNGRWNGVDLERRSNCTHAQNNGTRGTYAQFDVSADPGGSFVIAQLGITGLDCNYIGRSRVNGGRLTVQGTYSCTDGKQGDFRATRIDANDISLTIQMDIRLTGSESCSVEALLSMARLG